MTLSEQISYTPRSPGHATSGGAPGGVAAPARKFASRHEASISL